MTCWSCTHSRHVSDWSDQWLRCALTNQRAERKEDCGFEYEPGTDEAERAHTCTVTNNQG